MLAPADVIPRVLDAVPEFEAAWDAHMAYWDRVSPGVCLDLAALSEFALDQATAGDSKLFARVMDVIERVLAESDEDAENLLVTCFLETLLNYVSAGRLSAHLLVANLGPRSRILGKAWDNATGVQTEGL
jgi:hypothetical protein